MKLLNSFNSKNYGQEYKQHLFDQYKIIIDSVEKTSDRRNSANNFYLSLNTVLMTILGISTQLITLKQIQPLIYLTGLFFSIIFYFLINSYKQLNTGKFAVIHKIEKLLPINLYRYEWYALGEGKDKTKYYPFSHIEILIPISLGILYFVLLLPYINSIFIKVCSL